MARKQGVCDTQQKIPVLPATSHDFSEHTCSLRAPHNAFRLITTRILGVLQYAICIRNTQYATHPKATNTQYAYAIRNTQPTPKPPICNTHTQYAIRSAAHNLQTASNTQYAYTIRNTQPSPQWPQPSIRSTHWIRIGYALDTHWIHIGYTYAIRNTQYAAQPTVSKHIGYAVRNTQYAIRCPAHSLQAHWIRSTQYAMRNAQFHPNYLVFGSSHLLLRCPSIHNTQYAYAIRRIGQDRAVQIHTRACQYAVSQYAA